MNIYDWARKVQAIAQSGLTYCTNEFDIERYHQLETLVAEVLSSQMNISVSEAKDLWAHEKGYATPKIDVRGAVFREDKILLVRERSDGKWCPPGGWVDINDSPSVAVEREIFEESGFVAKTVKLIALFDKLKHTHPSGLFHIYKLFMLCEITGGAPKVSNETDGVDFFSLDALPDLSTQRITKYQIERMFAHHRERGLASEFD